MHTRLQITYETGIRQLEHNCSGNLPCDDEKLPSRSVARPPLLLPSAIERWHAALVHSVKSSGQIFRVLLYPRLNFARQNLRPQASPKHSTAPPDTADYLPATDHAMLCVRTLTSVSAVRPSWRRASSSRPRGASVISARAWNSWDQPQLEPPERFQSLFAVSHLPPSDNPLTVYDAR